MFDFIPGVIINYYPNSFNHNMIRTHVVVLIGKRNTGSRQCRLVCLISHRSRVDVLK